MLKNQAVAVGKAYVNEGARVVREVVEEVDHHRIKYNEFDLATGNLIASPFRICHKSQLARWADREARPVEIARFHPYEPTPWFEAVPSREMKKTELELTKANIEQVAGNYTFHRW